MSTNTGRADPVNGPGRREKRKRRRDDFVARADAQRHQRQQQRVGPRCATDRVVRVAILGTFGLELSHFLAEHELLRGEDPVDGVANFGGNRLMLSDQIDERHRRVRRVRGL